MFVFSLAPDFAACLCVGLVGAPAALGRGVCGVWRVQQRSARSYDSSALRFSAGKGTVYFFHSTQEATRAPDAFIACIHELLTYR